MKGNSDPECVKHNQYTTQGFRCYEVKLEESEKDGSKQYILPANERFL